MKKKVVCIMPQGRVDVAHVEETTPFLTITMIMEMGGSSVLEVPIEEIEVEGKKFFYTRYSSEVPEEVVIEAVLTH